MVKRKVPRLLSLLAAGMVAFGLIVVPSAPAQAAWVFVDGLENNPSATWQFDGQGSYGGSINAYTGVNYTTGAFVGVGDSSSWGSIGRSVYIPPRGFNQSTACQLSFTVKRSLYPNTIPRVRLEVINPSNWSYVTYREFTVINHEWSSALTTGTWYNGPATVFARIAVSTSASAGSGANIDNLVISCSVS